MGFVNGINPPVPKGCLFSLSSGGGAVEAGLSWVITDMYAKISETHLVPGSEQSQAVDA